jgi:hypothetical protein
MVSRTRIHVDLDRMLDQRDPLFYGSGSTEGEIAGDYA